MDRSACDLDEHDCARAGQPLFWSTQCTTFSLQMDGSRLRGISYDTAASIARDVFTSWTSADCGEAAPQIGVESTGPVACRHAEYNTAPSGNGDPATPGVNANVILFLDEAWPYPGAGAIIALTTVTFNVSTGEIYDADIEINSANNPITTSDAPGTVHADLQTVLAHEVGHFFGLDHSSARSAAMFPEYDTGELRRDLSDDDEAALCAVYPPAIDAGSGECPVSTQPRHGFSPECSEEAQAHPSCGVAPVPGPRFARGAGWAVGLLVGLLGRTRFLPAARLRSFLSNNLGKLLAFLSALSIRMKASRCALLPPVRMEPTSSDLSGTRV